MARLRWVGGPNCLALVPPPRPGGPARPRPVGVFRGARWEGAQRASRRIL